MIGWSPSCSEGERFDISILQRDSERLTLQDMQDKCLMAVDRVCGGGWGGSPSSLLEYLKGGAPCAVRARCAGAVRKVGRFPPPVATGPRVLNSAPPMLF